MNKECVCRVVSHGGAVSAACGRPSIAWLQPEHLLDADAVVFNQSAGKCFSCGSKNRVDEILYRADQGMCEFHIAMEFRREQGVKAEATMDSADETGGFRGYHI